MLVRVLFLIKPRHKKAWFMKETCFDSLNQAILEVSLTLRQVRIFKRQFIALTALLPGSKAAICYHMSFSHDLSHGNLYQLIQWP